jgi:hypothetical protein
MMDLIFVLKNFALTLALVYLMQFKFAGLSLEARFDQWLRKSEISQQSRSAAMGAALFIEESTSKVKNKMHNLWQEQVGSKSEKASK